MWKWARTKAGEDSKQRAAMMTIAVINALVIKKTTEEVARAVAVTWKTKLKYRKSL